MIGWLFEEPGWQFWTAWVLVVLLGLVAVVALVRAIAAERRADAERARRAGDLVTAAWPDDIAGETVAGVEDQEQPAQLAKVLPFLPREGFAPAEPAGALEFSPERFPELSAAIEGERLRKIRESYAARISLRPVSSWPEAFRPNGGGAAS